jgi:hypothetical protein
VYGLDNCCFMEADGDGFTNKIRRMEDGMYHVVGELVVAPEVTLAATVSKLRRLINSCGDRDVYIITPLPRYVNAACCDLPAHCTHRGIPENTLKLMCDLFRLRNFVQKRLEDLPRVTVVAAGDLLVGSKLAAPSDVMEATEDWGAVHGPNSAYSRMALNLIDMLKSSNKQCAGERKRLRTDSMDSGPPSGPSRARSNTGSGSIISIGSSQENSSRGRGGFARPFPMHGRGSRGSRGHRGSGGGRPGGGWRGGRRGR